MTLRVGFIGVGGIAQEHLQNVSKSGIATVTAVCDVNEVAAQKSASQYGATPYIQYKDMLNAESLDAVFICVPPFAHDGMEQEVIRRNIALFVEKPVGLTTAYANQVQAAIDEAGIINGSGYCLRYWDIAQAAKEYLADKTIAMVVGFYTTSFVQTPWWRQMAKSGGQLVEQTTHIVDLMRYLAGDVTQVHALMSLIASQDIDNLDIPDVGSINLQFASGAVGHIHTTFLQPDHRSGVEVYGNGFRLTIDGGKLTIVEKEQTIIKQARNNFYETQDIAFLRAVQEGTRDLILAPYEEARKTLAVTLAANDSAESGQVVKL